MGSFAATCNLSGYTVDAGPLGVIFVLLDVSTEPNLKEDPVLITPPVWGEYKGLGVLHVDRTDTTLWVERYLSSLSFETLEELQAEILRGGPLPFDGGFLSYCFVWQDAWEAMLQLKPSWASIRDAYLCHDAPCDPGYHVQSCTHIQRVMGELRKVWLPQLGFGRQDDNSRLIREYHKAMLEL